MNDQFPKIFVPILTFLGGFFISRFTLSKRDRLERRHQLYQTGQDLMGRQNEAFQKFSEALQNYIQKEGEPTGDDFYQIATTGENYFFVQNMVADAILTDQVDVGTRDDVLLPKMRDTTNRLLPKYYKTLQDIASRKGFDYRGELDKNKYKRIYDAVENFSED